MEKVFDVPEELPFSNIRQKRLAKLKSSKPQDSRPQDLVTKSGLHRVTSRLVVVYLMKGETRR